MLLFFVMAMVAAYANRALIFEQKISANVYRLTKAAEAAEGAAEWAVAELNGGRIDATCSASSTVADNSFRQRYLTQDSLGVYVPVTLAQAGVAAPPSLSQTCYKNAAGALVCSCPTNGLAALAVPAALPVSFAVSLVKYPNNIVDGAKKRPGVIRMLVTG
jgi:hypothetical protein